MIENIQHYNLTFHLYDSLGEKPVQHERIEIRRSRDVPANGTDEACTLTDHVITKRTNVNGYQQLSLPSTEMVDNELVVIPYLLKVGNKPEIAFTITQDIDYNDLLTDLIEGGTFAVPLSTRNKLERDLSNPLATTLQRDYFRNYIKAIASTEVEAWAKTINSTTQFPVSKIPDLSGSKITNKSITLSKFAKGTPGRFIGYDIRGNATELNISASGETVSGSSTFEGLVDTPGAFTGEAGKFVRVSANADAVVFGSLSVDDIPDSSIKLSKFASGNANMLLGYSSNGTLAELSIPSAGTTYSSSTKLDAVFIHDGTVSNTAFGHLANVSSDVQAQITARATTTALTTGLATKQATITSSARLNTNLIHDGTVSNTAFGHLANVSSDIQAQITARATTSALTAGLATKQATISSSARLNANLIHDGTVSNTAFRHIANVSSDIQEQLTTLQTNIDNIDTSGGTSGTTYSASARLDASFIHDGTVSNTAFGHIANVSSDVQAQITSRATTTALTSGLVTKQATITSSARLNANLIHDGTVSDTAFGRIANVSSDVQSQLDTLSSSANFTELSFAADFQDTASLGHDTFTAVGEISASDIRVDNGGFSVTTSNNVSRITIPKDGRYSIDVALYFQGGSGRQQPDIQLARIRNGVTTRIGPVGTSYLRGGSEGANEGSSEVSTIFNLEEDDQIETQLMHTAATGSSVDIVGDKSSISIVGISVPASMGSGGTSYGATNRLDAGFIHDGTVSNTAFGHLANVSSDIQAQFDTISTAVAARATTTALTAGLATKQATISSSARLNANLIHDGTVSNTAFGHIANVSSDVQAQITARATTTALTAGLATKQATISSSARLNANLIHDGTVSNTAFGHIANVSSDIQAQLTTLQTNIDNINTSGDTSGTTYSASVRLDASFIHDGTVSNTAFGHLANVSSDIQAQITARATTSALTAGLATKQATISSSARLNANLIHDGSVSNTAFGHIANVSSDIQDQFTTINTAIAARATTTALTTGLATKHPTITSSARLNANLIHDGTVSNTAFGHLANVSSDVQAQITARATTAALTSGLAAKQTTISSSSRLNANLIHDGTVSNTAFGHLANVSSDVQAQITARATTTALTSGLATKQATISSSARIGADLIHDGTVSNTEFGYIANVSSDVQEQLTTLQTNINGIDTSGTTYSASARLDASFIHDGTVSNTAFGYIANVTSDIQAQFNSIGEPGTPGAFNTTQVGSQAVDITTTNSFASVGIIIPTASNSPWVLVNLGTLGSAGFGAAGWQMIRTADLISKVSTVGSAPTIANSFEIQGGVTASFSRILFYLSTVSGTRDLLIASNNSGFDPMPVTVHRVAAGSGGGGGETYDATNRLDTSFIHDGTVSNTAFGHIANVSSDIQAQITARATTTALTAGLATKQATISSSARLGSDLIHDGSVSNTAFGHIANVSSDVQEQLTTLQTNINGIDTSGTTYSASARLDASFIHDGTVSNTAFGHIANVSSDVQAQIDSIIVSDGVTPFSVTKSTYQTVQKGTAAEKNPWQGGTASSIVTVAHGLGKTPDFYETYIECIVATSTDNYSMGDRIPNVHVPWRITIQSDETNTYIIPSSATNRFGIADNDSTRTSDDFTASQWKLVAVPYIFVDTEVVTDVGGGGGIYDAASRLDASFIHDGTVSNTAFGHIANVSSDVQEQLTTLQTNIDGIDTSGAGSSRFTELLDTPSEITAGRFVKGNAAGEALEFATLSATDIPALDTGKIGTGTFNTARLASGGSDGQVLTRTGTGMAWEDTASGGTGGTSIIKLTRAAYTALTTYQSGAYYAIVG